MAKFVANFNFDVFIEKEKLKSNGSNFINWFHNLRMILTGGKKAYVLEEALGGAPTIGTPTDKLNIFEAHKDDYTMIKRTILYIMEPELQNCFEAHDDPVQNS
jgi:hypothetical protein